MKSLLLIALTYSQVLMADHNSAYQSADFCYETTCSTNFMKSEFKKENRNPKWVGKTCAIAAVSAVTFALFTLQASLGTPSSPYKPFVAAGVAGAATYAYFEFTDD